MHRIDTSTAQKDKFGAGKNGFTGGNPQTGELPTALDQDFFDSVQEELCNLIEQAGLTLQKSKRTQVTEAIKSLFSSGRLLQIVDFTASGTYPKNPKASFIIVEVTAGGGPGGSTPSTGSQQVAAGAGGGAGGTSISRLSNDSITATVDVTVGKGGTAMTASNGSAGASSNFGAYLSATGGAFGANATAVIQGENQMTYNGGGGDGAGGNLENIRGGCGVAGFVLKYGYEAGEGGRSHISAGGPSIITVGSTTPGIAGRRGSGGSGAFAGNNATPTLGGNGGDGLVRVWEFA